MDDRSSSLVSNITKLSRNTGVSRNTGACSKKQCTKSIGCHLPPIKQPNRKAEEIWGVKALPLDFKPVSKPSKIIENLNKKRQMQHEEVLAKIKTELEAIDLDVEAQIRLRSELLKRDYQEGENEIQQYLNSVDLEENDLLALNRDHFIKISETISQVHEKYKSGVDKLHEFLEKLENERSDKYKKVLNSAYKDLHKISYNLPYDLQQYFEEKILRINQMLLNNLRCYSDLKLQLKLQAENNNRLHTQNLDVFNTKWKQSKKKDVLVKLNEKKLVRLDCEAMMLQTEQGRTATKLFSDKGQTMGEMWMNLSPLPICSKDVNVWSENMQITINGLDFFAQKLITLYKMAIVQVFNGYFDELQNLTEGMLEMGWTDTEEMSSMGLELCKPAIETVTRQYSNDLLNLEMLWDSVRTQLQSKLQSTYVFLNSAAHLWDSHFQRIEEAQTIVMKDLKNVIQKNDKTNQDQEIKLNIALDVLRQASTDIKLKDALEDVNDILDNFKNTYNSHYITEVKVIEKYEALVLEEIEVLLAELQQFLHQHPKPSEMATQIMKNKALSLNMPDANKGNSLRDTRTSIIPKHMKLCEYQVDAVHNWMFGLREAIEIYAGTCREEIIQQANEWSSKQIKKLAKRLEVKLAIHTPRYERVKYDIFDVRLAELKSHADRMARHKAGALKEIDDIKDYYDVQEKQYKAIIRDYNKKVDEINKKISRAKTSHIIKAYISNLNYNTDLCNRKLSNLMQTQESTFYVKLNKITEAATKFSKQLKLFLEEGSFNYDEAKKVTKDLKIFEKAIKKKFTAVTKEVAAKQKQLFIQVQQEEMKSASVLNYSLEEFEFIEKIAGTIKNVQDDIKADVCNIKFLYKQLEQQFKEMEQKSITNLGDFSNFECFENSCSETVLNLLAVINSLYQPEPVVNVSKKGLNNIISFENQRKNVKENQGSSNQSLDNYVPLLFDFQPVENNSFISKICCKLYDSLQTSQADARDFYATRKSIVNKDKVQPTFGKFMKEVLRKYFLYHLQCEVEWLNLTSEYFEILKKFNNFFTNYQSEFFEKYAINQVRKLQERHKELLTSIAKIKRSNVQALNQVNRKLKPLHGFDSNKHLLDELQNEMKEVMNNIRSMDIEDLLKPYKESQETHVAFYEAELTEARKKLTALYNASFDKLLCIPLIQQFDEKLSHIKSILNETAEDNEFNQVYANITLSPKLDENLIYIKALSKTHYANRNSFAEEDDTHMDDLIQSFKDEYNQYIAHTDLIKSTWHTDTDAYEQIFKADVQRVLKLYHVKYNNPQT